MTKARPSDTVVLSEKPSDTAVLSQNLRGSTEHIMSTLYKYMMGLQGVDTNDRLLGQAAAGESRMTKFREKLEIPSTIAQTRDVINVNLNKIERANTAKKVKSDSEDAKLFLSFKKSFVNLASSMNELQSQQGSLIDRYVQMIKDQHAKVREIFEEMEKENGKPMSLADYTKYIDSSLKAFEKEVDDFDKKKEGLKTNLAGLDSVVGKHTPQVELPAGQAIKQPTPGG